MLQWKELVRLPEGELAALDVAEVNLACAVGLPGAPTEAQAAECIARLDYYAECVRDYTEKRLYVFRERASFYENSEAKFRMVCLVTCLSTCFQVRYHPDKRDMEAPLEARDRFIHGPLLGAGGICASLPVVYAAVGRRLGYPLRLVSAYRHLFLHWEAPCGERFHIEANDGSMDFPEDDHYRQGIYAPGVAEEKAACYLVSKTPRMELAGFLTERSVSWLELGQFGPSVEAALWACALMPQKTVLPRNTTQVLDQTLQPRTGFSTAPTTAFLATPQPGIWLATLSVTR